MTRRPLILLTVATAVGIAPPTTAAQTSSPPAKPNTRTAAAAKGPRTAWGHPDLQGVWANNVATPLERPQELAGRAFLRVPMCRENGQGAYAAMAGRIPCTHYCG
jgi:hypothetical protein